MNLLTLATAEDAARLVPLIAAAQSEAGLAPDEGRIADALGLLFSGEVQAAIWVIGPRRAPVGFLALSFGFSLALGGREATVDTLYIRPAVRGRGMGGQAMHLIVPMLRQMGVLALHAVPPQEGSAGARICARNGFAPDPTGTRMTRLL